MPTPGSWLRDARAAGRLSLRELAERTGLSHGYINKLELDKHARPNPESLRSIARALGRHENEILAAFGYLPDNEELNDPELLRVKKLLEPMSLEKRRRTVDALELLVHG